MFLPTTAGSPTLGSAYLPAHGGYVTDTLQCISGGCFTPAFSRFVWTDLPVWKATRHLFLVLVGYLVFSCAVQFRQTSILAFPF